MDPNAALDAARAWPIDDRLDLVFRLWDQLAEEGWQPEPDADVVAELDARLKRYEANPSDVRTWDQIEERLRTDK